MAIEKRERKTAGRRRLYSYRVKWRLNGTGAQQARTLDNEAEAIQLEDALRKSGWRYSKDDPEVKYLTLIGGTAAPAAVAADATPLAPTLYEAVTRWANRPSLSRGSKRNYMQVADNRLDSFGTLRVDEVTLRDVEDWLNTQTALYSQSTAFTSMVAVCGALRAEGFGDTVAKLDKIENARRITPIYLDEQQVTDLVEWVEKTEGENFAVLVELTAKLGPRWGEGCGLQLVHCALKKEETAHIWIRQAVKNDQRLTEGFRPERAKTKNAERMLPLNPHLTERMRAVTEGLTDSRAIVFRPHPDQVQVFRSRKTSAPFWAAKTFNHRWRAITAECPHVPDDLRWHDLRHTAAKNMLERGVPIAYVSKLLGHSKVEVTINEYGSFDQRSHDLVRSLMS